MVFLLHVILFSFYAISLAKDETTVVSRRNVFLSRRKRYLIFPAGSNFVTEARRPELSIRKHLHRMGKVDTPLCRGCEQEDETVEHILCDCPTLSSTRQSVFGEYWPTLAMVRETPPGNVANYFKLVQLAISKALVRVQPTGWNVVEEMDYPFALPTDTRLFRKSSWINRDRRDVYSSLEQGLTKSGFNGTSCVKKMICDARKYVPMKGKSMVKDILLAVFSYTGDDYKYEEICTPQLDTDCTISIMDYVLQGIAMDSF